MTIADMRQLLGLGDNVSDAAVAAAYAAFLAGDSGMLQAPPISLADAKRHLRLTADDTTADEQVAGYIADAMGWVERYTGHILIARDVTATFRVPSHSVEVRAWPIKPGATMAVAYAAGAGPSIAVDGAWLDLTRRPARVWPAANTAWPLTRSDQILSITLRAGYEAGEPIPANLTRAMLVLISAFDSDREGGDIFTAAEASAKSLCRDYRLKRL